MSRMAAARAFAIVVASAALLGCPAKTEPVTPPVGDATAAPEPTPEPEPEPEPVPAGSVADGGACTSADQCSSGVCEGEGCDDAQPGKCMPKDRMCTKDAREYCGCDGKTFIGSGSCPGARFQNAGECSGDPGPI
jgi:hypothetical protein